MSEKLNGKTILITGAAKRVGRIFALAVALAPNIIVNGLALGAILPPSDGKAKPDLFKNIPAGRWAEEQEVEQALLFAFTCPAYITGEIIHVDGGRHLV